MQVTKREHCPVCTANALAKSHVILSNGTEKTYNFYGNKYAMGLTPNKDNLAIHVLIGKVSYSCQYLENNLLVDDVEYEAYISVARNLIEKLALINFIFGDKDRRNGLGELYANNSYDFLTLFSAKREKPDLILNEWKEQNRWTSSNIENRVKQLNSDDINLIYAYSSRVMHGLNRDELLKRDTDQTYMMAYIYIITLTAYHKVFTSLPKDLYKDNIRNIHKDIYSEAVAVWEDINIPTYSILEITGFALEHIKFSAKQREFIKEHNAKLKKSVETGVFANYKITDH